MDIQKKIGRRIALLRNKKLKLSQQKFSYEVDIDRGFLSNIETGKKAVSIKNLEKIIKGLGVTWKEFFESEEFEESN